MRRCSFVWFDCCSPSEHLGIVAAEVAYRALPEYDLRGTDVAFVSQSRWDGTDDDDNLKGSP